MTTDQILEILAWVASGLLVLAGVAGVVIPVMPGSILVFAGLTLAASLDGFERVGWVTVVVLAFLTVLTYLVDAGASLAGAGRMRASRTALIGAVIGTVAGLPFGIPGILLGPVLGAAAGEWIARRDLTQAGRVGLGTGIGLLLSTVLRFGIVCVMIGLFVVAYVF